MTRYNFTFYPTNLDVLFDTTRNIYVQRIEGIKNATDDPEQRISCIDLSCNLRKGKIIDYKISEYDLIKENLGLAEEVLSPELKKNVCCISELVEITGKIVKRV